MCVREGGGHVGRSICVIECVCVYECPWVHCAHMKVNDSWKVKLFVHFPFFLEMKRTRDQTYQYDQMFLTW